jgi:hypothetical protein
LILEKFLQNSKINLYARGLFKHRRSLVLISTLFLFTSILFAHSSAWARAGGVVIPVAKNPGAPPAPTSVATTGKATANVTCTGGLLCGATLAPIAPFPCNGTLTTSIAMPCVPALPQPTLMQTLTSPTGLSMMAIGFSAGAAALGGGGGNGTPANNYNGAGTESATGGNYGNDRGGGNFNQNFTPAVVDSKATGTCPDAPSAEALAAYNKPSCKAKTQTGSATNAFIVDADSERAWVIPKDGSAANAKCFIVTLGKNTIAGQNQNAKFGQGVGSDQTPAGLLVTSPKDHSNVFPQGHYTAMKGLDDQNSETWNRGVYLHEWHAGGTQGCIGIKGYQTVRDLLGYNGAPVFVWGKAMKGDGCGGSAPAGGAGNVVAPGGAPR